MGAVFFSVLIGELIEVVVETLKADEAGSFDLTTLPDGSGLDDLAVDQLIQLGSPDTKEGNGLGDAEPLGLLGFGGSEFFDWLFVHRRMTMVAIILLPPASVSISMS